MMDKLRPLMELCSSRTAALSSNRLSDERRKIKLGGGGGLVFFGDERTFKHRKGRPWNLTIVNRPARLPKDRSFHVPACPIYRMVSEACECRAPDTARIKAKMMYASTKDFFKGYLDGLSIELQGSALDDVSESEANQAVRSSVTRQ